LQEFTEAVWENKKPGRASRLVRFMRIVARALARYRKWRSRIGKTTIEIPRGDQ
jgi:hypothetical protein